MKVKLLLDIYLGMLICSSAIGLVAILKKMQPWYLRVLPFFILYIFCVERYSIYLNNHYQPNAWLYNFSSVIEFTFYQWLISQMYKLPKAQKISYIVNGSFAVIALINIIFFQGKTGFHSITFALGSFILIATSIFYFYQVLLFPSEEKLMLQPQFWVCTAVLFSFFAGFPIFCLNNFYNDKVSESIWPMISKINYIINIIYYALFAVGFICGTNWKYRGNRIFLKPLLLFS